MKKQINKVFYLIFFSLFLIGIINFSTIVYADDSDPFIGEDDVYEKYVETEKTVHFNWTIYKDSPINYVVTVLVQGFESWNQKISPNYFFLDDDNPYEIVGLKATIPQYPETTEKTAVVSFVFRPLNSTESITIIKTATIFVDTTILGAEENTILGLFQNPLPDPFNTPISRCCRLWTYCACHFRSLE